MGHPHCPALANGLGVWCYFKMLDEMEAGKLQEYHAEVNGDGELVRILEAGAPGVLSRGSTCEVVRYPFPNVEIARG